MFTPSQGLCSFSHPGSEEATGTRSWERTRPGQVAKGIFQPMSHHAQSRNWGELFGRTPITAWGQAGHQSAGGELLYCASLGCFSLSFISLLVISLFITIISILLYFNYYTFQFSSPSQQGIAMSKQLRGTYLLAGVKPHLSQLSNLFAVYTC